MHCFRCFAHAVIKGSGIFIAKRPQGWVEVEVHIAGQTETKRVFVCPECWLSLSRTDEMVGRLHA